VEQTVLVGDSRIDFETARAAGTAVCLTRYGFGYEGFPIGQLRGDEGLVDTPSQIPEAVERLLGR
jgi:phosphoglycolate phosphatase-like HAD superfamily hydrolase